MIRYAHTNIITDDWRRLARFYADVFGCVPRGPERDLAGDWLEKSTGVAGAHLVGIHLALPGFGDDDPPTLEIFQYDANVANAPHVANRRGFGHIAFKVDDVRAMLAKVVAAGGGAVGEVVEGEVPGAGAICFVYARDPDGNIIELQRWG